MNLSYKDLLSTVLAFATFGIYYAQVGNFHISWLTYRIGTVLLFAIGLGMCAFASSYNLNAPGAWTTPWAIIATTLGVVSLIVAIISLIVGNKIMFTTLAFLIIGFWLITTIKHAFFAQ